MIPQTLDDIERRIVDGLDKLAKDDLDKHSMLKRPDWTKNVKRVLIEAANSYPVKQNEQVLMVSASGSSEYGAEPEWLFDLTWYVNHNGKREGENRIRYKRQILVMECEWSAKPFRIMEDFQKLMIAKCEYRVMVFNRKNGDLAKKTFDILINEVKSFDQSEKGDRYLLCGMNNLTGYFHFRHYIHQA